MAYDQGLYGLAQRYYLLALHACREGSSPDLGAKVIGDMTQLSTALGRYEDSLGMVRTALYSLPRQASGLVRSELLGLESRAYAQLGDSETGNADRSAQSCVAVYEEAPRHEALPDWIHYMNQAEVDCLAANTYIELALHADDKSRWRHYAAKGEVHSLPARQNRNQGYIRSRSSTRSASPRSASPSASPPSPPPSACTPSGSPPTPAPPSSSTGSPSSPAT